MRMLMEKITIFLALLIFAFGATGCNNARMKKLVEQQGTTSSVTITEDQYGISNVSIAGSSGSSSSSTRQTVTIYFDASNSTAPISNHCLPSAQSGQSEKACLCQFGWNEINTESGYTASIPRIARTSVKIVQPNLVQCDAPDAYAAEIADSTSIKINIIPAPSSAETFSVTSYTFVKNPVTDSGSFKDAQGRSFVNILRYSCYDHRTRGMGLTSVIFPLPNPANADQIAYTPLGTQFCAKKAGDSSTAANCEGVPAADYSSQSYYYNLYIRETEVGDINPGNLRYTCPTVKEALSPSLGGIVSQYYPLDTSFALSMGKTVDFTKGIEANSRTTMAGDNVSRPTSCDPQQGGAGNSSNDNLAKTCLGFAAVPNSDGTCPYFRDETGTVRQTFRLRRYIAIYPPFYEVTGEPIVDEAQATDTIYVLDRPVLSDTNPDPFKPYTMLGPKPCPFAYFDHKRVADTDDPTYYPSYLGTNNVGWHNKNVDGIQFPNQDSANSCSASLPLSNSSKSAFAYTTIHRKNATYKRLYVRPQREWAPSYVEDKSFEACAPLADPLRDPPLHFAKDASTGNVAYCAEVYPTQNDNVAKLDPPEKPAYSTTSQPPNATNSHGTMTVTLATNHIVRETLTATAYCTPPPGDSCVTSCSGANTTFDIVGSVSGKFKTGAGAIAYVVGNNTDFYFSYDESKGHYVASAIPGDITIKISALAAMTVQMDSDPGVGITCVDDPGSPFPNFNDGDSFSLNLINTAANLIPSGKVTTFSSHVSKNSASAGCTYTPVTTPEASADMTINAYPGTGVAKHTQAIWDTDGVNNIAASKTCDRTVVKPTNGSPFARFPLLAPPSDVETALAADKNFQCTVSYDANGAKGGKQSPTQGCCGASTKVWTGTANLGTNDKSNAHLEPDAPCQAPKY